MRQEAEESLAWLSHKQVANPIFFLFVIPSGQIKPNLLNLPPSPTGPLPHSAYAVSAST